MIITGHLLVERATVPERRNINTMPNITELRAKLRAGEALLLSANSLKLFMQECQNHPVGDECYKIEPYIKGVSRVYDPVRVKVEEKI